MPSKIYLVIYIRTRAQNKNHTHIFHVCKKVFKSHCWCDSPVNSAYTHVVDIPKKKFAFVKLRTAASKFVEPHLSNSYRVYVSSFNPVNSHGNNRARNLKSFI